MTTLRALRSELRARSGRGQTLPEKVARACLTPAYQFVQNRRARGLRYWQPVPQVRSGESVVLRAGVDCVDAHNHLGRWLHPNGEWTVKDVPELVGLMDSVGVAAIVNLDGRFGDELAANVQRYDAAYPGRFVTFCHLDWRELAQPGFGERLADGVRRSAAQGAGGLKIWKDLGLSLRDHRGRLLRPDSPELDPVWGAVVETGLPVLIHTADPPAFFQPLDRFNERLEELLKVGRSHGGGQGRHAELLASLERLVANHPAVSFIAAHMASNPEDLGWVDKMLSSHANLAVDMSASLASLGRQPRATRRLLVSHPGQVLFGTDRFPPDAPTYQTWFRFLETDDEAFPHSPFGSYIHGRWAISGLDLPPNVLDAVYAANARRLMPALGEDRSAGKAGVSTEGDGTLSTP
jgi:predicted TIM-barrel fold metal-dependent hydrolase